METPIKKEYKKASPIVIGALSIVFVLSVGAALGIVTGVVSVPNVFADCDCGGIIEPPPIIPPPVVIINPPVCTLHATPASSPSGQATLSWTTALALTANIDGVGSVALSGSQFIPEPSVTTTYTMHVTGTGGNATCSDTITVTPPVVPPPVCTLTVTPTSVVGTSATPTLSWTTTNATSFSVDQGVTIPSGSIASGSVGAPTITTTTTYTGTATGAGGTSAPCTATVVITPPPPGVPVCTLSVSPTTYAATTANPSVQPTLSWTTSNAVNLTIDHAVGSVIPVPSGSSLVSAVSVTTTYTGIATAADGTTSAPCTATIVVTPPTPNPPVCTLTVSPTTYAATIANPSIQPTLTWTTSNAVNLTIDHAVGSVIPVPSGSSLVSAITTTTTYTGVATAADGSTSAPCTATIVVTPPPGVPACTLTATPTTFVGSGAPVLSWTTVNAVSFTIDNTIGSVTPVAVGSTTAPTITTTTTYTGVATAANGATSAPCTATVTITTTPVLACTLTAAPTTLPVGGGTTVLTWTSTGGVSFAIDHGIPAIPNASIGNGSTTTPNITNDTTFTGTVTSSTGTTANCTAAVTVPPPPSCTGCCAGGCGGGGGGGGHPNVTLSVLRQPGPQPLAFVYLSQIPYTGLDLGPVGTVAYWVALIAWSLAVAYLVLFILLPYVGRRMQRFGADVHAALNVTDEAPAYATVTDEEPAEAPVYNMPPVSRQPVTSFSSRGYSAYDGFRSFAKDGALSIDDIVGGLSRETVPPPVVTRAAKTEPIYENVEPIYNNVEPVYQSVEPIREAAPAAAPKTQTAPAAVAPEVPGFITAIINGEREAVFNGLRAVIRAGGDAEAFLSQAICALDDAYRARIDGTAVHPEIAHITKDCATPFLERLVTSLSTAVDSSYSTGITGAKLALTRALAVSGA